MTLYFRIRHCALICGLENTVFFFLHPFAKTMENGKSIIAHIFICSSRPEKRKSFHIYLSSSRCEVAIMCRAICFVHFHSSSLVFSVHARTRIVVHIVIKIEMHIYYHDDAHSVVRCAIRTQACQYRTYERPTEPKYESTNEQQMWRHSWARNTSAHIQFDVIRRHTQLRWTAAYKITIEHRAHIYSRKQTFQRYTCLHCINSASYTWTRAIACEQYRK